MLSRSRSFRTRRAGEWTEAKAVTFIVILAASRSVTLAATRAGMSRKSAYSLKSRDPFFAAAWEVVLAAPASRRRQGDKVGEICARGIGWVEGNKAKAPKKPAIAQNRPDGTFEAIWEMTIGSTLSSLARDAALP